MKYVIVLYKKNKLNAPKFAYSVLYNEKPPSLRGKGASHPKKRVDGIEIDKEIPTKVMKEINRISGITPRSSCQGQDENRPSFLIFLPENQDENYVSTLVKNIRERGVKADYTVGNGGFFRVCITDNIWYNGKNKRELRSWWLDIPNIIRESLEMTGSEISGAAKKEKHSINEVEPLVEYLEDLLDSQCNYSEFVGSYRRGKRSLGDLEILISGCDISSALDAIRKDNKIKLEEKRWEGKKKAAYIVSSKEFGIKNLQLEVYYTDMDSLGSNRLTRTGPSELNIHMRRMAKNKGLKLNEYGLFDKKGNKVAGKTEKGIFKKLNMEYLTPKQRQKKFG